MTDTRERPGRQIGDYRLGRRLGGGGFGQVYLAEDQRSGRQIAVKLLNATLTEREDLKAFLNEVRSFLRLTHPCIVPLLDLGMSERDQPFLVMEYIDGGTLRQRYPRGTRVPLAEVVRVTVQVASALQYAHDQHLIHRDVKPENMLWRTDGTVLLGDFGLVTVAHASSSISLFQIFGGTLPYMAPEQHEGKPQPATDQYALAVVVYEWLAGGLPFQGTPSEIALQHLHASPPPLRDRLPTLPGAVEQVVLRALSKQPKDRFASVQDFTVALREAFQPNSTLLPTGSSIMPASPTTPEASPIVPASGEEPPVTAKAGRSQSVPDHPTQPAQAPAAPSSFPAATVAPLTRDRAPRVPDIAPHVTTPPQGSVPFSTPPARVQPGRQWLSIGVAVRLVLILALLGTGIIGVYDAATGKWPWKASYEQPTSLTSHKVATTTQATATAQAIATAQATATAQASATAQANSLGRTWHVRTSGTSVLLQGVVWSGTQFVAVGYNGTILTSLNGISWTPRTSGTSGAINGAIWAGTQFVVVGDTGTILTSPNGITWTPRTSHTPEILTGIAWSGTQFVVVGYNGTILTSPDGITWTPRISGVAPYFLAGAVWAGTQFVVVGGGGDTLTSPNGIAWTLRTSSANLWGIAWSRSRLVVVGVYGLIRTSPDGITWTTHSSGTSQTLMGVAWSGTQFVAVGDTGAILTSPDGISWTPRASGVAPYFLWGVVWSGTRFVAVGDHGTVLTSP